MLGGGGANNAQPAAKSHASPGQLCVDTAPRAAAGAVGAPPHEGDAPTTQQLLSQGSDTDSTLTKQPPTLAALITHAGWLVPPATQAYEFGMDSDDGSDFAISFDGSSWDVVASWCVCGACTRGWPLSLCCRCCCLCVCVLPAARVFAVDGLSARAPPGARPLPPPSLSHTHCCTQKKRIRYGLHGSGGPAGSFGTRNLVAGTRYPIRIRFHEHGGGQVVQLYWRAPGGTWGQVPWNYFYAVPTNPPTYSSVRTLGYPEPRILSATG